MKIKNKNFFITIFQLFFALYSADAFAVMVGNMTDTEENAEEGELAASGYEQSLTDMSPLPNHMLSYNPTTSPSNGSLIPLNETDPSLKAYANSTWSGSQTFFVRGDGGITNIHVNGTDTNSSQIVATASASGLVVSQSKVKSQTGQEYYAMNYSEMGPANNGTSVPFIGPELKPYGYDSSKAQPVKTSTIPTSGITVEHLEPKKQQGLSFDAYLKQSALLNNIDAKTYPRGKELAIVPGETVREGQIKNSRNPQELAREKSSYYTDLNKKGKELVTGADAKKMRESDPRYGRGVALVANKNNALVTGADAQKMREADPRYGRGVALVANKNNAVVVYQPNQYFYDQASTPTTKVSMKNRAEKRAHKHNMHLKPQKLALKVVASSSLKRHIRQRNDSSSFRMSKQNVIRGLNNLLSNDMQ